jgi:hypothetical protein
MAWFGPAEETLEYLKRFLPRGVVKDMFGLQEALEMLVNAQTEDGSAWAKRFRDHEAYQKYVDDPLNNRYPDLLLQTRPLLRIRLRSSAKEKLPPPIVPRAGLIQKFLLLVRRTFRLLWRDGTWFSMLVIPPLVALAFFLFSSTLSTEASRSPLAAGLPVFIVILTSALLVQYEILKERPVYQRENQTSSILVSYVLSKVFLVGIWAIYQGLVWTIVDSLRELGPVLAGGLQILLPAAITFSLLSFVGGVLGLMVSSLARTAMTPGWVLLLILPLLFFMFDPLSHWSRWAIISLLLIVLLTAIQQRATRQRT